MAKNPILNALREHLATITAEAASASAEASTAYCDAAMSDDVAARYEAYRAAAMASIHAERVAAAQLTIAEHVFTALQAQLALARQTLNEAYLHFADDNTVESLRAAIRPLVARANVAAEVVSAVTATVTETRSGSHEAARNYYLAG